MNSPFLLVPVLGGRLPVLAVQGEGHHIDLPHPGLSSHGLAAIVLSSSAPWWSLLGGVAGWPGREIFFPTTVPFPLSWGATRTPADRSRREPEGGATDWPRTEVRRVGPRWRGE